MEEHPFFQLSPGGSSNPTMMTSGSGSMVTATQALGGPRRASKSRGGSSTKLDTLGEGGADLESKLQGQYDALSFVGATGLSTERRRRKAGESQVGEDILINCCCPGPVRIHLAHMEQDPEVKARYEEEAAETPVFLATLPWGSNVGGRFWRDKKVLPWDASYDELSSRDSAMAAFAKGSKGKMLGHRS